MYTHILIRYGELTIKGKNKKYFLQKLYRRLKQVFPKESGIEIETNPVRSFLTLPEGADVKEVFAKLETVFGLTSASLAIKVPTDLDAIKEAALRIVENECVDGQTVKLETKRSYKQFPLQSWEVSREVAGYVFKQTTKDIKAEMKNPDSQVFVEIRKDESFVMLDRIELPGGLPQGSSGKGALMLSGGIDSPVAGYLAMKKGINLIAIHFASPPYTSNESLEKIKTLVRTLEDYQGRIKLFVVPFTEIQQEIVYSKMNERYHMIIMRRMMYRIAEKIMEQEGAQILVNGESVGQVASQTLASMAAVHTVVDVPIMQPLAALEKNEIIKIATDIDTYDTSVLPFEDCCTIFVPKSPVTQPKKNEALEAENKINVTALLEKAVENTEIVETLIKKDENTIFL